MRRLRRECGRTRSAAATISVSQWSATAAATLAASFIGDPCGLRGERAGRRVRRRSRRHAPSGSGIGPACGARPREDSTALDCDRRRPSTPAASFGAATTAARLAQGTLAPRGAPVGLVRRTGSGVCSADIMMWLFGILGAIAATIYWRYGVYVELSPPASWYALGRAGPDLRRRRLRPRPGDRLRVRQDRPRLAARRAGARSGNGGSAGTSEASRAGSTPSAASRRNARRCPSSHGRSWRCRPPAGR